MRVVHISKVTGIAGSEGHLLRLLPGLVQKGLDIHMLVLEDPNHPADSFCQAMQERGIPADTLPITGHIDPQLPGRLKAYFQAHQPDMVHTHLVHADWYGLLAARWAGVPFAISSRHNDNVFRRRPLFKALNKQAMRRADRVITISHALNEFVCAVEGLPADKVVTVRYGLETPPPTPDARQTARERLQLEADVPVVGMVGRLIPQKGIDILLRAFTQVVDRFSGAKLVLVGDGLLRAELEAMTHTLGLDESVIFTGWVDEGSKLMPACDVITVPSRWEGFGMVTLEAMGYNLPLVASRVSALPEIIVDDETGYLVPPEEPAPLAQAICTLLADPSLAAQMGRAGYQRLVEVFSIDAMINSTLSVYESVTGDAA